MQFRHPLVFQDLAYDLDTVHLVAVHGRRDEQSRTVPSPVYDMHRHRQGGVRVELRQRQVDGDAVAGLDPLAIDDKGFAGHGSALAARPGLSLGAGLLDELDDGAGDVLAGGRLDALEAGRGIDLHHHRSVV